MKNTHTPTLETERLILRKFNEFDIDALFAIYSDEEVNVYLPWFPLKTREEAKLFLLENYLKNDEQRSDYRYAICLKSDHIPIGYVHVSADDNHDLGYGLRKEYWHKGIVSEAAHAVLKQVKKDGFLYVTATHDIKNIRSGNVMQQLGMNYKYSYEEQWQPKNKRITFRMYQRNFDGHDDRVYNGYWNRYGVHFIEQNVDTNKVNFKK